MTSANEAGTHGVALKERNPSRWYSNDTHAGRWAKRQQWQDSFLSDVVGRIKAVIGRWQSGVICVNEIQQIGGSIEYGNTGDLIEDAKLIIDSAQRSAHQAVNVALVVRNWLLGRRIAEEELGGDTRLELYGRKVVPMLAKELTATYGKGYTRTSLYQYVQFYRMFPEIVHAASGQSHVLLTWTHYRELLRVQNDEARAWYEREAASQGWSVKQLSRNISSQYCERMLSSGVELSQSEALSSSALERAERLAFVKSPMVMEFLGLPADPHIHESDLESSILDNLQQFLLELGKGYAFVARQQHIRTEWDDFYIDLVFYNYILRCFVLIDLKASRSGATRATVPPWVSFCALRPTRILPVTP